MENEIIDFSIFVSEKTDEALIRIVTTEKASYHPQAVEAAKSEIKKRGIKRNMFYEIKNKIISEKKADSFVVSSKIKLNKMYCKSCGKYIEADSRFCLRCGTLQKTPLRTSSNQPIFSDETTKRLQGIFGVDFSQQIIGIFLIWFLFHLILLLINLGSSSSTHDYFYPFSERSDFEDYGFSEFLFYTIVPLVVLIIINLFKQPREIRREAKQSKYDLNYERDFSPTLVGITMVIFLLQHYFININDGSNGNLYLNDAVFSIVSFVVRVVVTIWVHSISYKLNRNTIGWSIFAFFLPSIALIVIGFQRKLKRYS